MTDFDVAIVGAGHNGLTCAAYLARAGLRVCVVERMTVPGGASASREVVPGYQFDVGGSTVMDITPMRAELDLQAYGYELIDLDPQFFAPFPGGEHLLIWRDVGRTCDSIAAFSPADADRYARFCRAWTPFIEGLVEALAGPPSLGAIAWHVGVRALLRDLAAVLRPRALLGSYADVLERSFHHRGLQAAIGWMAAQSGAAPDQRASGMFAAWHAFYHRFGLKRPRGGAGSLARALIRLIEAHGGRVLTGAPVRRIRVHAGRVEALELADGASLGVRAVVSAAHIVETLTLLGDDAPPALRRASARMQLGEGLGLALRCALRELPDYLACPGVGPQHGAVQLICPDLSLLRDGHADLRAGRPARQPAIAAMTFSALDDTLAPKDRHVLSIWAQYYPYQLADGRSWRARGPEVADHLLATLARYAPNVPGAVLARQLQTPLDLEEELGLRRGNITHLAMSPGQTFFLRPARGFGGYRCPPIRGLYLSGASTHPGGGITGASGRLAARVVLRDWGTARTG